MKNYTEFKEIKRNYRENEKAHLHELLTTLNGLHNIKDITAMWVFRDKLTQRQQQKPLKDIKNILKTKLRAEYEKKITDFNNKCDKINSATMSNSITISVEWSKNRTWGLNPHATVCSNGVCTYGSASGCGYDKLSSAVASALNGNYSILKLLYTKYEMALRKNKNATLRESLGYGSGYKYPYFEGGVGYSSHKLIFENLGAKINLWQETKYTDYMFIEF